MATQTDVVPWNGRHLCVLAPWVEVESAVRAGVCGQVVKGVLGQVKCQGEDPDKSSTQG